MKKPILAALFAAAAAVPATAFREATARISDADFWKLTVDLSEPGGQFRSDNLLSNEMRFQTILDDHSALREIGEDQAKIGDRAIADPSIADSEFAKMRIFRGIFARLFRALGHPI